MLRFFWRIFRASYSLHLLLPLAVSVALGGVIGYFRGDVRNTRQLLHYLVSERVMDLAAIYIVFIIVVLLLVSQSAELRIANLGLLDDILPKSTAYFALAATPLREWFDPSIQVYLARIAAQQRKDPNFHHVRVLLFFTKAQLLDAHASYQDEYYAKCLIKLHDQLGASLAFLEPVDLFDILEQLSIEQRLDLRCYPPIVRWLPKSVLSRLKLSWMARNIRSLAFARVQKNGGGEQIVVFGKHGNILDLSGPKNPDAYVKLAKLVEERIYQPGTTELKNKYRFDTHMAL